jgi:hypothetical protein
VVFETYDFGLLRDGADELNWLLTLGAVVRTEDGESLRKGVQR